MSNNSLTVQGGDLSFSNKNMVSVTHEQNIIYSKTQLDSIAHEQTIICRKLFAGHMVYSRPMTLEKKCMN